MVNNSSLGPLFYYYQLKYLTLQSVYYEVQEPILSTDRFCGVQVVNELKAEPVDKKDFVRNWYPRHRETHKLVMALRDYGLFR